MKRRLRKILLASTIAILGATGCDGTIRPAIAQTAQVKNTKPAIIGQRVETDVLNYMGDKVEGRIAITVKTITRHRDAILGNADPGKIYVTTNVLIEAIQGNYHYNPLSFRVRDSESLETCAKCISTEHEFLCNVLYEGDKVSGETSFEVAQDAKDLILMLDHTGLRVMLSGHVPVVGSKSDQNNSSPEASRAYLIGTWTYTKPGIILWSKWVIKDDDTLDAYLARPSDNGWGTSTSFKWVSITDKDPVTGDRTYGIMLVRYETDHLPKMLISGDGTVKVGGVDPDHLEFITMERGDKFPFSK